MKQDNTLKACLFIQTSFRVWFPRLTAVTRINKRLTEFAFLYCSSVRGPFAVLGVNFISEYRQDLPSSASACFIELLTYIVNCLLNDVTEVGEVLGVRLDRNVQIPKIQNHVETVFPFFLDVFIQAAG